MATERRTLLSNGDVIIKTESDGYFLAGQARNGLTPAQYIDEEFAEELIKGDAADETSD